MAHESWYESEHLLSSLMNIIQEEGVYRLTHFPVGSAGPRTFFISMDARLAGLLYLLLALTKLCDSSMALR